MGFIAYTTALLFSDFLELLGGSFRSSQSSNILLTTIILTSCFVVNFAGARAFKWSTRISFAIFITSGFLTIATGLSLGHSYFLESVQSKMGAQTVSFLLVTGQRLAARNPISVKVLLGAAAILFFAYWGLETAIAASGEVKNPQMAIPKGMVAAVAFTTVYYILYSMSVYTLVPWEFVAGYVAIEPNASVLDLYSFVLPSYAVLFVSLGLAVAVLSDIFPLMFSASRIPFAWAFDGLMPKAFTKLNSRGVS